MLRNLFNLEEEYIKRLQFIKKYQYNSKESISLIKKNILNFFRQDKGEIVQFLKKFNIKNINPLRIHLHCINNLQKYQKMPLFFGPSKTQFYTLSVFKNSFNIFQLH